MYRSLLIGLKVGYGVLGWRGKLSAFATTGRRERGGILGFGMVDGVDVEVLNGALMVIRVSGGM